MKKREGVRARERERYSEIKRERRERGCKQQKENNNIAVVPWQPYRKEKIAKMIAKEMYGYKLRYYFFFKYKPVSVSVSKDRPPVSSDPHSYIHRN